MPSRLLADHQYAAPAPAMESRPSRVRWSELIHAGVRDASRIRVRFSRLARKLCWILLASRKLGLWDACIANECVVGRMLSMWNHLRLPIARDLASQAGKGLEGALAP